jgi:hypothetical protein
MYREIVLFFPKYSINDLIRMEQVCLNILDYKLIHYNSQYILDFFLNNSFYKYKDIKEFICLTQKILDFFVEDIRFLDFTQLEITVSILSLSRELLNMEYSSYSKIYDICDIKLEEFMNCFFVLKRYIYINEVFIIFRIIVLLI